MNRKSTAEQVGLAVTCYLFVYVGKGYQVFQLVHESRHPLVF